MGKCFFLKSQRKQTVAMEAMEKLHGARLISEEEEEEKNGVVRMKIVVSKKELKKMMASMGERERNVGRSQHQMAAPESLEELLHVIQRRHMKKVESERCQLGEWQPVLQTIPEEI